MAESVQDESRVNELAVAAKTCRTSASALVVILQPRLVELVRASSIHRNDRADAVQEVLIQVLKCIQGYDPARGDFRNYAMRSAKLILYRVHERNGASHSREVPLEAPEAVVEASPEPSPRADLATIPDKRHRDILGDYYGIDRPRSFSINQIAARRGLSNAVVREAIQVASRTLREVAG